MDFVPLYDEDNGASLPARGAWIEMLIALSAIARPDIVAPRTGSVD